MKKIGRHLLVTIAISTFSLTVANISALAVCQTEIADEYTCYPTGEDAQNCYYTCYCKVPEPQCEAALDRDGFDDPPEAN